MLRWLLAAALLLALAGSADARMHHPARGHRMMQVGAPLDTFTQPSGAYSFRKLKSTYAGPAIRIRRASDNAELDIGFLGFVPGLGAPPDVAAMNAHCAATSCFIRTWYDQSGNARDATQLTAANQPALVFNCNGSLPCARSAAGVQRVDTVAVVTATTSTYSIVANRRSGTAFTYPLVVSGASNHGFFAGNASDWGVQRSGGGFVQMTAVNAAWHAAVGVINGAASLIGVDGTETAGTVTGAVDSGPVVFPIGDPASPLDLSEAVTWQGYALTPAERIALTNNQRAFWGF